MLGAWQARSAAVNVNYRYGAAELAYVLADSGARAVIYHGAFAATLAAAAGDLPDLELLLQADDGFVPRRRHRPTPGGPTGTPARPGPGGPRGWSSRPPPASTPPTCWPPVPARG